MTQSTELQLALDSAADSDSTMQKWPARNRISKTRRTSFGKSGLDHCRMSCSYERNGLL